MDEMERVERRVEYTTSAGEKRFYHVRLLRTGDGSLLMTGEPEGGSENDEDALHLKIGTAELNALGIAEDSTPSLDDFLDCVVLSDDPETNHLELT